MELFDIKKIEQITQNDSFKINDFQYKYINENKGKSCFMNGYDFVKIAASWAKSENENEKFKIFSSKKLEHRLFTKEQFSNNPEIDLIFQIIAYSRLFEIYEDDEIAKDEIHKLLLNPGYYRKIGQLFNYNGFFHISEIFEEADKDSILINKLLCQKIFKIFEDKI